MVKFFLACRAWHITKWCKSTIHVSICEVLDYYVDKTNRDRICSHIPYWIIKLSKKLTKISCFLSLIK